MTMAKHIKKNAAASNGQNEQKNFPDAPRKTRHVAATLETTTGKMTDSKVDKDHVGGVYGSKGATAYPKPSSTGHKKTSNPGEGY